MGGDDGAVLALTATVLLGLHDAILPVDGLLNHMCTVGRDDALPADGLLKLTTVYVPVNGDDGAILPAEGLLWLLMYTLLVGGDDGAILPADGLLKHMCTVGGMMVQYSLSMYSSDYLYVLLVGMMVQYSMPINSSIICVLKVGMIV